MEVILMSLVEMFPGQCGVVTGISDQSALRRRLQDLGLIPGTVVECIGRSPLGDHTAYQIRRTVIALRKEDAGKVFVREVIHG